MGLLILCHRDDPLGEEVLVILLIVLLWSLAAVSHAQELVMLSTRPGATQSYFLARAPQNPQAIVLLFPGSGGFIRLRVEDGQVKFSPNNFLVRSRGEFVKRGVVADLNKRFPRVPLFLIGTSRGTVSAAALASKFGHQVSGVVLTATMFRQTGRRASEPGPGLSQFDFTNIKIPLLFVHHSEDLCVVTPYNEAARLSEKYPLISVSGGLPPKSDECEALSAHGFLGKESETIEEIVNWILKKPFRTEVK